MKRRRWLVASVAVSLLGAAVFHGFTFMASYNAGPPAPLWSQPDLPRRAGAPPLGGDVVLFVVDGLIADGVGLLELREDDVQRAQRCELRTVYPSFSRPSYVAMLTGAPPTLTGIHTNGHRGPALLDHVVELAAARGIRSHLITDGVDWWDALFGPWETVHVEARGFDDALQAAFSSRARGRRFFLVHMVIGDDAGHAHGAASDEYAVAMRRIGERITRLLRRLRGTSTTMIVLSDHGHLGRGGHGGPEPAVVRAPLLAWGPAVTPRGARCERRTVDVASTLAGLLQTDMPRHSIGAPIAGLAPAWARGAAARQRQRLATTLGATHETPLEAVLPARRAASTPGGLAAALGWALLVLVGFRLTMGQWPLLREILSNSLFSATFIALYAVVEPALSFSAVWVQREWLLRIAVLVALAMGITVALRRLLGWRLPAGADDSGEQILSLGAAGALVVTAWGLHGSWAGGPTLGDPHSAFALIVGDVLVIAAASATLIGWGGRALFTR